MRPSASNQLNYALSQVADFADIFTGRLISEIPQALRALCDALVDHASLEEIDLSDNAFGGRSAEPMVHLLSSNLHYRTLKLTNNGMGPEGGSIIARALKANADKCKAEGKPSSLRAVICGRNRLENGSSADFAAAFAAHGQLEEVRLFQNGIRMEGIEQLATHGLAHNATLRVLDLQDNTATLRGSRAIAASLDKWPQLEVLNLGDCLLKPQGGERIFQKLAQGSNKKLITLQLAYCDLDRKALATLARAVEGHLSQLTTLDINGNWADEEDECIEAIRKALGKWDHEEALGELDELDPEGEDEDEGEEEAEGEEEDSADAEPVKSTPIAHKPEEAAAAAAAGTGTVAAAAGATAIAASKEEKEDEKPAAAEQPAAAAPQSKIFTLAGKNLKLTSAADIEPYLAELRSNPNVEEVHLGGNTLGTEACEALAKVLQTKKSLKIANFADIFTGRLISEIPQALRALCDALVDHESLEEINLSDNAFGGRSAEPMVNFLENNHHFSTLKLSNNGLGITGGTVVAEALQRSAEKQKAAGKKSSLRTVICGRNRLENGSAPYWAKAFAAHGGLEEVRMYQNGIRMEGIEQISQQGLAHNANLRIIDFQDNTLTLRGSKAIAALLPTWPKLENLNLGESLVRSKGALLMFEQLAQGTSPELKELDLSFCELNRDALSSLAAAIKAKLPKLAFLNIDGNYAAEEDDCIEKIREALESHGHDDALQELEELDPEGEEEDDEEEADEKDEDDDAADEAEVEQASGAATPAPEQAVTVPEPVEEAKPEAPAPSTTDREAEKGSSNAVAAAVAAPVAAVGIAAGAASAAGHAAKDATHTSSESPAVPSKESTSTLPPSTSTKSVDAAGDVSNADTTAAFTASSSIGDTSMADTTAAYTAVADQSTNTIGAGQQSPVKKDDGVAALTDKMSKATVSSQHAQ